MSTKLGTSGRVGLAAAAFEPHRDPARAEAMAAYMRDRFVFFGIPAPERDRLIRDLVPRLDLRTERDILRFAAACWEQPEREYQYLALRVLRRSAKTLSPEALQALGRLITVKSWWDTVDELAIHVTGPLVATHPELRGVMDAWIEDDDIWLARTAILHQNSYKRRTDAELLFRYCLLRAADSEFFIRKAIGWALREYSKTDPEAVRAFVERNGTALAPLSRREALRRLAAIE